MPHVRTSSYLAFFLLKKGQEPINLISPFPSLFFEEGCLHYPSQHLQEAN
jgi:hypothetical protein